MSTKSCPFCGKEISDEAIICKFCHRLLIDENGKDILPEAEDTAPAAEAAAPSADPEDQTRIFSKEELRKAMNPQPDEEEYYEEEIYADENTEEGYYAEEEYYDDAENAPAPLTDEEFYQEFGFRRNVAGSDEYDPKRTFIITAIITLGILLVVVGAVLIGSKLFNFKDTTQTNSKLTSSASASDGAQDAVQSEAPAETSVPNDGAYAPEVTDDTVSENPEVIIDNSLIDPAGDSSITIVIPGNDDSMAATTSTDDSTHEDPDNTNSEGDSSSAAPAGEGAPSFSPSGAYYNWDEAGQLMSNYAAENGLGSYSYYDGTDGVEMIYVVYDDMGNSYFYRVDLVTGYVTPY